MMSAATVMMSAARMVARRWRWRAGTSPIRVVVIITIVIPVWAA